MTPPLGAWGLTGTPVPLPGGHRNVVLRVGDYVLKTTRRSETALRWLGPVHDVARAVGLNAPGLVPDNRGWLVCDGWTCEPFCPGVPTPPGQIGAKIAAFHAATRNIPQRPGFADAHTLLTAPRGGDIDLTRIPEPLVAQMRKAWAAMPSMPACIVHADLNPANILTAPDGTITVLDWDEARRDHKGFDAIEPDTATARARLAWEIACCWEIEPERARALAHKMAG